VESEIKGAFFTKEGMSKAVVSIEKDAYQPQEVLTVKTLIDNTKCAKSLDKIHFSIKRHIESREGSWIYTNDEALQSKTFLGVPSFTSQEVSISFALSEISDDTKRQIDKLESTQKHELDLDDLAFQELMTPTTNSKLIKCSY